MSKPRKPTVTVFVDCPHCKSELKIEVFKKKIGAPEPAEYDITTTVRVVKQGRLFDSGSLSAAKGKAEAKVA